MAKNIGVNNYSERITNLHKHPQSKSSLLIKGKRHFDLIVTKYTNSTGQRAYRTTSPNFVLLPKICNDDDDDDDDYDEAKKKRVANNE